MAGPFDTPAAAEAAFYDAMERADLDALGEVWATGEGVCCVHPGTDRIEGRTAVLDSFARMFAGDARLGFEIVDARCAGDARLAVRHVRERIRVAGRLAGVMAATNVYVVEGEGGRAGWRMLMHHASHEHGSPSGDGPGDPGVPPGRTLH